MHEIAVNDAIAPAVSHAPVDQTTPLPAPAWRRWASKSNLGLLSTAALAACKGSKTSTAGVVTVSTPTPAAPTDTGAKPTEAQASRFLTQATMGATRDSITDVVTMGFERWLDTQFAMSRTGSLWDAVINRGESAADKVNSIDGYDASVWRALIQDPDQLRQRVGTALLDFLVVGMGGLTSNWIQFSCAGFLDILMDNAFGNYRTILEQVTLNPAMAVYLSSIHNKKANPVTGAAPDENYAREVMQLFSIGLHQLNMDGTVKTSGGVELETYTQKDVSQLARIFTGLAYKDWDWRKYPIARTPLIMEPSMNETGSSTFLGKTISGGGMAAVNAALDHIFAHSNVAPFISKQLIQRLVTSNPTPGYVERVATVFADNGKGVRGDLRAVVRAILLDKEARSDTALTSTTFGRLRVPAQRLTAWARAFKANSPSNAWAIGDTSSAANGIGHSIGHAPSVFNFFRPGYTPPGSAIATLGLVAPEFQIANEQSIISYVNFMHRLVSTGVGDVKADYSSLSSKVGNSQALVDELNLVLCAGQLTATTVSTIRSAVDSASGTDNRIWTAVLLTLAAPEFLVTR
ncbi:DUF1800 domain-containing protein [Sphingomonas sp. RS2018]